MNTCSTCRHWHNDEDNRHRHSGVQFNRCSRIRHDEDIENEACRALADEYDWSRREAAEGEALAKAKAYCQDGSGYMARVRTAGDFGCVLHEVKP